MFCIKLCWLLFFCDAVFGCLPFHKFCIAGICSWSWSWESRRTNGRSWNVWGNHSEGKHNTIFVDVLATAAAFLGLIDKWFVIDVEVGRAPQLVLRKAAAVAETSTKIVNKGCNLMNLYNLLYITVVMCWFIFEIVIVYGDLWLHKTVLLLPYISTYSATRCPKKNPLDYLAKVSLFAHSRLSSVWFPDVFNYAAA